MANGKKTYEIVINGIQQSIDAVDALNKQLDALEKKFDALSKKNISVSASGGGSNTAQLKQEEKLLRQIDQLHKKVADTEKKEYQELLHAKEELKEYQQIAKAIAAEANISSGVNNPNTMLGMKAQLKDIKAAMQVIDVDSDKFKQMQKQANDLNTKLKELESGYGQYGRNVGNYANGVVEGFNKIKVAVGGSTREYDNYRQAVKDLTQERFKLSQSVGTEADEYKQVDTALKRLISDYQDLNKSSAFMDNLIDSAESFAALASIGVGLSNLFGIDDAEYQETMQKFASLTLVLQGLDKLYLQVQTRQGLFAKAVGGIGDTINALSNRIKDFSEKAGVAIGSFLTKFSKVGKALESEGLGISSKGDVFDKKKNRRFTGYDEIPILDRLRGANNGSASQEIDLIVKGLERINKLSKTVAISIKAVTKAISLTFATITGGLALLFGPELLGGIIDGITNLIKSANTTKLAAERAAQGMKALNRELEIRRDILSASYLKGEINDEQYLNGIYDAQTKALKEQINALQLRAKAMQNNASLWNMFDATQNTEFSGRRMETPLTVGRGRFTSWASSGNDLQITVKDIKELENAWNQCNEAVNENKDYFDKWQGGLKGWWNSLWATVKDTEEVMRGLGNVNLSDVIARFGELNDKFNKGEINADQYAKGLQKLKNEMNDSKILNSVIANLDKYIPDEGVREAVQNIINEIYRLDDAFNMTSQEQIHYWNQVRIDAMKDGMEKELAQIRENERYELATVAKTEEQQNLLRAKYERQRLNAQERANKERVSKAKDLNKKLKDAENELISLRIENMNDGLEKQLAQIENERRLALQKAADFGKANGEITLEINKKYDRKILEEKRKWAYEILRLYEDLESRIEQVNRTTFEKEVETAERNVSMRESQNIRNAGYSAITPSNYDNTKDLEAYYKKVYDIQKKALDTQTQIRQESLDREIDFNKKEEEIRHKRVIDENNGEYIQQLRAGRITQEQYNELIERENAAHLARMNALEKEYESNTKNATEENLKDTQELYVTYFDKIVNGIISDRQKIDEVVSQPLITDEDGWQVVNIKRNREVFNKALADYESLKNSIIEKQRELDKALKEHTISAEDFAVERKSLDDEMDAIDEAVKNVRQSSRGLIGDFMQSIQQYIQAVGQAATSIIQSIGEINDAAFERQIEAIERQTEALEEQLDKQRELTQKYANDVESIEDELATARGDRRQHLIDQLNAQMAAQRESLAQEKRIEKEQERLDKKRERLEYENEMRKWNQSKATAAINAALAISNAAVNNWPIPAIPMMALATAVGAAQMAAVLAQKPKKYADGGVLVGKSHRQGGIKLLNGSVEAEGGEYITNKRTTSKNIDLLDYINSKKKRVDLTDMIEFYADKSKKNINGISKRYFADGGYIPPMRSDIDLNDRFMTAMEQYAERPTYVSVVDIINKADNVRSVQTLAGLEQ